MIQRFASTCCTRKLSSLRLEFSLARKYLLPKKGQLSVSLICLLSVAVITLVVWLLLTFLSVTSGIEKGWLHKLTSLNAPLRIQPTHHYFNSYYYQIDSIASKSGYALKTIGEKLRSPDTDPYLSDIDQEIPLDWQLPETDCNGCLVDLVKEAFYTVKNIPGTVAQEYDVSGAMLRLKLVRGDQHHFLSQVAMVTTFAEQSSQVKKLLQTPIDTLSCNEHGEPGILLPQSFQQNGVMVGDRGFLSYNGQGAASGQELRQGIHVAGFYDPGIMSVGPKFILAPQPIAEMLHSSGDAFALDPTESSGIQVWFDDLQRAPAIKAQLVAELKNKGIDRYFNVQTYQDYDFAKDLLQQFQSDKMLFTLISIIILAVAASNIVSSLILLVNNKKRDIGILQSMGASKKSIALTFALCGMTIGIISSLLGGLAAYLTLHNINTIVSVLSWIQGHDMFNALFYGHSLPSELSASAVKFITIVTPLISLIAGLIPAIKACRYQPTEILRST